MILNGDPSPTSDAKASSNAPVSARGESASSQDFGPPPSYGALELGRPVAKKSTCARFWRAFVFAVLIIVCMNMFMPSAFRTGPHHQGGTEIGIPEVDKDDIVECATFSESSLVLESTNGLLHPRPPLHAFTSFTLPSEADVLFFLSRGPGIHGNVRVKLADEDILSIVVDVNVWYWASKALDHVSVCQLHKMTKEGENHGVGVFSESGRPWWSKKDEFYFEIEISLPAQSIKSLKTDYSNFGIMFDELAGLVHFDRLAVKTSNGKIHAETLSAEHGALVTHNGAITGTFNTSSELELVTSNAKIAVDVALNIETPSKPTKLVLRTSNGKIDGVLSLIGEDNNSAFDVISSTTNAQAMITVSEHPNSAPLKLIMTSSNGRARAVLHPAFEGDFVLRTSHAKSSVIEGSPNDPKGDDRERVVDLNGIDGGFTKGKVYWGEWNEEGRGSVNVATSNARIELDLSGE